MNRKMDHFMCDGCGAESDTISYGSTTQPPKEWLQLMVCHAGSALRLDGVGLDYCADCRPEIEKHLNLFKVRRKIEAENKAALVASGLRDA